MFVSTERIVEWGKTFKSTSSAILQVFQIDDSVTSAYRRRYRNDVDSINFTSKRYRIDSFSMPHHLSLGGCPTQWEESSSSSKRVARQGQARVDRPFRETCPPRALLSSPAVLVEFSSCLPFPYVTSQEGQEPVPAPAPACPALCPNTSEVLRTPVTFPPPPPFPRASGVAGKTYPRRSPVPTSPHTNAILTYRKRSKGGETRRGLAWRGVALHVL